MVLGDWILTVTGTIVRVVRENLDKSGRNPRYMLSFVVRPETVDAPSEVRLADDLAIRIKELELPRLARTAPEVGERVTLRARASGPRPATFYLIAIERPNGQ